MAAAITLYVQYHAGVANIMASNSPANAEARSGVEVMKRGRWQKGNGFILAFQDVYLEPGFISVL
jgi:hypothetical protein